jgi:hypothetical protein
MQWQKILYAEWRLKRKKLQPLTITKERSFTSAQWDARISFPKIQRNSPGKRKNSEDPLSYLYGNYQTIIHLFYLGAGVETALRGFTGGV